MKKFSSTILVVLTGVIFLFSSCRKDNKEDRYVKKVQLNSETIAVGIYKPTGVNLAQINYIAEAIKIDAGMVFVTLNDADVINTKLENIDVIIFPGMKKGDEITAMDKKIEQIFRDFIKKKGKSAIGLCNGSKFITCVLNQSLDSANFKMRAINDTTRGLIKFNLTTEGEDIFPELIGYDNLFAFYRRGFEIELNDDSTNNITVLGKTLIDGKESSLFIKINSGLGKILLITPQLESTPGMRWMIPRMVRWLQGKKIPGYDNNIVRPNLYSSAFDILPEYNNEIEKLKGILNDGSKKEKIIAMDELQKYYPWLAAEDVRKLLSERNDDIKLRAAKYLVDIEYTMAIEDINYAIKKEHSRKVRAKLLIYKEALENMTEQN